MEVILAQTAGFCMGVKRAIEMALEAAQKNRTKIYTYGPLIHNRHVLEMLEKKGIKQISNPEELKSGILLIRAHGIAPQQRKKLESTGLVLIDATCPRVQRIHGQIRKHKNKGSNIIIFGDADHAEVTGLLGTADDKGHLISSVEDLSHLPLDLDPVLLVSQTTQSTDAYNEIKIGVQSRYEQVKALDTLCATTEERQDEALELIRANHALIVVGGKNSANTARLAELCQSMGKPVYHIETEEELPELFPDSVHRVAVTAGASTPNWMIERVVDCLESRRNHGSLKNIIINNLKALTESNILVALGSASLTLTCIYLLDIQFYLTPVLIAAFYVYSMHILNHFADREAVAINEPLREEVFRQHQNIFILFGVISGSVALLASALMGKWAFLLIAFLTATGGVYSFPIVPRSLIHLLGFRRLKDIPASKDVVVALAWSSVTVLIPILGPDIPDVPLLNLFIVWLFAIILVYIRSVLLDLKDVQGDRMMGKETIPLILGEKKTLQLLRWFLIAEIFLLTFGEQRCPI